MLWKPTAIVPCQDTVYQRLSTVLQAAPGSVRRVRRGPQDCGRAHSFGGLALLDTDVPERRRSLVFLCLLDTGEDPLREVVAGLFLATTAATRAGSSYRGGATAWWASSALK